MVKFDLTGLRVGHLTVLSYEGGVGAKWLCRCDCGKETLQASQSLRIGSVHSCGCVGNKKHGHRPQGKMSKTYACWNAMRNRCRNPNHKSYPRYGGRGIKVCERWNDYANFLEDMREAPAGLSLDRIDNNGDYCKENCRWVDMKVQGSNRENVLLLTHKGETANATEWARRLGVSPSSLVRRHEKGWSDDEIFSTPFQKETIATIEYRGEKLTYAQAANRLGVTVRSIYLRIKKGMSSEAIFATPFQR